MVKAATALEVLGIVSMAISVILAFWNAVDNSKNFTSTLSDSLVQIGATYLATNAAGKVFSSSDVPDLMVGWWGADGEVVAALIPMGFAIVSGIVSGCCTASSACTIWRRLLV